MRGRTELWSTFSRALLVASHPRRPQSEGRGRVRPPERSVTLSPTCPNQLFPPRTSPFSTYHNPTMSTYPYEVVATSKYKPPPGQSGLSFAPGDQLTITASADDDGDWLNATDRTGAEGVIPASSVQQTQAAAGPTKEGEVVGGGNEEAPADPAPTPAAVPATPRVATSPAQAPAPAPTPTPAAAAAAPNPDKPMTMKERLAFFNAQAAAQTPGPPAPRPKPTFARKPVTQPTPAPTAAATPAQPPPLARSGSAEAAAPPPPTATESAPAPSASAARGEEGGGMSAADAQASIGAGGSLRDRIKALQSVQLAQPGLPGRAPVGPKPWQKKKSLEDEGNEAEQGDKGQLHGD